MSKKEAKPVIKGIWEEVIKASGKVPPKPKPKKKVAKKKQ